MAWIYVQRSGKIYQPGGQSLACGYSGGNCGKHPEGKNNPAMQDQHNIGPVPVGLWHLSAPQDSPTHGPYAMDMTPDKDTNTYGRSGFKMHGDSIVHPGNASDGCIIMPRFVRERIWESGDHDIEVISGDAVASVLGGELD